MAFSEKVAGLANPLRVSDSAPERTPKWGKTAKKRPPLWWKWQREFYESPTFPYPPEPPGNDGSEKKPC
jgi:hypothetical protein